MTDILNLGSCCIDHVYHVPHFVVPGETLLCHRYEIHPGGKGLNQSIAIARAGGRVRHVGKIGHDGAWLKDLLEAERVDTTGLIVSDAPTGHANIQVNEDGENSIVLFGGTNQQLEQAEIEAMLATASAGDWLVLQNETSELAATMDLALAQGLRVIFNAAPMSAAVSQLPLGSIDTLIVNEIEGEVLTGESSADAIMAALGSRYPDTSVLLTLGADGARVAGPAGEGHASAPRVDAVDTTGAGDTFTGYFIHAYTSGRPLDECLGFACRAAAISVTRAGAASSIPHESELL